MINLNVTLIIQLAIVLTLMVILSQIVFRPFLGVLQARKNKLDGAAQQARELQQRAEELIQRYREAILGAQAQGAAIRDQIRKEGLEKESAILKKAAEEADQLLKEMRMKIAAEVGSARAALKLQAQNLSREIAEKILGRRLA